MKILDRVRELGASAADRGRGRVNRLRAGRRRHELLRELGEARYAESKGVATSAAEIERLVREIDDLDRNEEPETAAGTHAANDQESETQVTDSE